MYEIIFSIKRKQYRWCRFAATLEQARVEVIPAIIEEYGERYNIISIVETSIESEDKR